ncbi:PLDc N-terminal domain-containing protein [Micromonospora mangrovi]|uniref:PLD nuclease N-terminal domain-containing protein n=2 Tax=Micromonospora TaxID=1873 RepID=A0AAU7M1N0_9ACTN|nr:PLD nuclease N-terminal domain-containing protein [Micromonospora sp. R77]MCI4064638.1 PLD nuclease N-terminal domain-containing protein [Micromonospora sp. R77]
MVRLYGLLFLAEVVLGICALISCLSAEEGQIRALPRIAWVLIILIFPLVGSIAWFVAGREPAGDRPRTARPVGNGFAEPDRRRQVAPDDDPEFLSSLAERSRQQDRELFSRWEEDLRRREDELRRRDGEQDRPEV